VASKCDEKAFAIVLLKFMQISKYQHVPYLDCTVRISGSRTSTLSRC